MVGWSSILQTINFAGARLLVTGRVIQDAIFGSLAKLCLLKLFDFHDGASPAASA